MDSLQRLYAVVVALAITESVRRLSVALDSESPGVHVAHFVALMFTAVPFFHGMNRHLDLVYLVEQQRRIVAIVLLIDLAIFIVEGVVLFWLALHLGEINFFPVLAGLLFVDAVWGLFSFLVHHKGTSPRKSNVFRWSMINFTASVALLLMLDQDIFRSPHWIACGIIVARTISDYVFNKGFYFSVDEMRDRYGESGLNHQEEQ